jgi:hypothetical protein
MYHEDHSCSCAIQSCDQKYMISEALCAEFKLNIYYKMTTYLYTYYKMTELQEGSSITRNT